MPSPALKPPKSLLRQVGRAIADYRMIRAGDRLLLGVSGGKDSLSHGQLRTMKAHYVNKAGDLRIIRPLAYCRERQTADFARAAALPVVADSCPACFALPTRREHTKALLAREEAGHPQLFANLLHAMRPLLTEGPVPGEGTAVV